MSNFPLPIIDMSKVHTECTQLAHDVVKGLENVGFLYIDNVKGIDFDKLFEACKWFFNLPKEAKMKLARKMWNSENENVFRGYFPVAEDEPTRIEAFEFGRDIPMGDKTVSKTNWMYEKSVWPEDDKSINFKEFLQNLYEIFHETTQEILRLVAIGLGIDEHAFVELFSDKPISTFRLLHYPPWKTGPPKNAIIEDNKVVTIPEHTDSEFMTLLHVFDFKGLEVVGPDEKWIAIPPRLNSLIMNIGVTFSRMMGGRFKATRHRVLDIGIDRFSVPFFLAPSFGSDIGINFMSRFQDGGTEHVVEKYGPWYLHRVKHVAKFYEFRNLPDIDY